MENKKCLNKQCFCDGSCKKPQQSLGNPNNVSSVLFDNEKFKEQIEKNKNTEIEFRIGVSKIDPKQLYYCLVRAIDKTDVEVLLLKTMDNEQNFDLEVLNLQKIFDAFVIVEK